ncbi:MAG: CDP-diacylglycerol--serine O-phosphatidyltransferase [Methanotrichaceae archaeon]
MNILSVIRLPDLLSILNAALGFGSILAAYLNRSDISVLLIILAAAADGLDGFLARRFGSGPLGTNLDSFADLVSFGVAPAVFVFMVFRLSWITAAVGAIYLACGMLRLARFNLSPKGEIFEGLPIPPCGIAASASVLLGWPELTLALMIVLSALMISSIPYPKVRSLSAIASLILICLIIVAAVWVVKGGDYAEVLPYSIIATIVIYIASPVVMQFLRRER